MSHYVEHPYQYNNTDDPFLHQQSPQQAPPNHRGGYLPAPPQQLQQHNQYGGGGGYPPPQQQYANQHQEQHHQVNGNGHLHPHHHAPAAPHNGGGVYDSPSEQHRGGSGYGGAGTGTFSPQQTSGQLMFKSPHTTPVQRSPVPYRSPYSSHSDSSGGGGQPQMNHNNGVSPSPPHTPLSYGTPRAHSPQSAHHESGTKQVASISSPPLYGGAPHGGSNSSVPYSAPAFHTPSVGLPPLASRMGHRTTPSQSSDSSSFQGWNTPNFQSNGLHSQTNGTNVSTRSASGGGTSGHGGANDVANLTAGRDSQEVRKLSPEDRRKLTIDDLIVPEVENLGPCPATVAEIAKLPCNDECADCQTKDPDWVSVNLGIFVCIDCAGEHRHLGTDYSKVRSWQLDEKWQKPHVVEFLHRTGNERSKKIYERCVPSFYIRPSSLPRDSTGLKAVRENWIKAKYMRKEFVSPKGIDESKEGATVFAMPEPVLEGYLSAQTGGWRNKWQKRWFVLYHRYLLFYQDANYSTAAGRYDVTEMTYDLADNESSSNTFVLRNSQGKETPLIAESTTDLFMWIHALKRARLFYKGPLSKNHVIDPPTQESCSGSRLKQAECSGYLVKQGGDVKNWRKRYFVILDDVLYYFKFKDLSELDSGKEVKRKGYIHLLNCEVTSNGSTKIQPTRPNCFCVFTPDRQYFMCAENADTMRKWVTAIQATASKTSRRVRVDFKQDDMRSGGF